VAAVSLLKFRYQKEAFQSRNDWHPLPEELVRLDLDACKRKEMTIRAARAGTGWTRKLDWKELWCSEDTSVDKLGNRQARKRGVW